MLLKRRMSRKYLVLTEVDGTMRFLSMKTNGSKSGTKKLCYPMVKKLFPNHKIGDVWIGAWPLDEAKKEKGTVKLTI